MSDANLIVMRIPVGAGMGLILIAFDPFKPAPVDEINRRIDLRRFATVSRKSPYGEMSTDAPAQAASVSPGEPGEDRRNESLAECIGPATPSAPDDVDLPPSAGTKPDRRKQKDLSEDIAETRLVLAEKSNDMARVDRLLEPFRYSEGDIRDKLIATYEHVEISETAKLLRLNLPAAPTRRPLFKAMDDLRAQYGPLLVERASLNREVRELERLAEHLVKSRRKEITKGVRFHA